MNTSLSLSCIPVTPQIRHTRHANSSRIRIPSEPSLEIPKSASRYPAQRNRHPFRKRGC
nr:MAG TPA: hypothetical protein [Caudoviricetes sp.]